MRPRDQFFTLYHDLQQEALVGSAQVGEGPQRISVTLEELTVAPDRLTSWFRSFLGKFTNNVVDREFELNVMHEGKSIGSCLAYLTKNGKVTVGMIEVDKEYRRRGIATLMAKRLDELGKYVPQVSSTLPDGRKFRKAYIASTQGEQAAKNYSRAVTLDNIKSGVMITAGVLTLLGGSALKSASRPSPLRKREAEEHDHAQVPQVHPEDETLQSAPDRAVEGVVDRLATSLGHALRRTGKLAKNLRNVQGEEAAAAHAMAGHLDELAKVYAKGLVGNVPKNVGYSVVGSGIIELVDDDTPQTQNPRTPRSTHPATARRINPDTHKLESKRMVIKGLVRAGQYVAAARSLPDTWRKWQDLQRTVELHNLPENVLFPIYRFLRNLQVPPGSPSFQTLDGAKAALDLNFQMPQGISHPDFVALAQMPKQATDMFADMVQQAADSITHALNVGER